MFCSVFQVLFRTGLPIFLSFSEDWIAGMPENSVRRYKWELVSTYPADTGTTFYYSITTTSTRRGALGRSRLREALCAPGCNSAAMVNQLGLGVTTQRTRHATSRHGHNKKRLRRRQNQKRLPKSRTGRLSGCPSVSRYHTCAQP